MIAQKLGDHAAKSGRTLLQFALAWLWRNPSKPGHNDPQYQFFGRVRN